MREIERHLLPFGCFYGFIFFAVVGEEKICLGGANNKEDDTRVLAALGSQAMPSTMKGEIVVKTCSKCSIRGYEHFQ